MRSVAKKFSGSGVPAPVANRLILLAVERIQIMSGRDAVKFSRP